MSQDLIIVLEPIEDGYWMASVPGVQGCRTQGATEEEALERLQEAIALFADGDTRVTIDDVLKKHGIQDPSCGADIGPGWVPIVDRLIRDLLAAGWDGECAQIKEKFGGLRFYVGGNYNAAIDDLISQAEQESIRTCEHCGEPGTRRSGGWIVTLCVGCAAKPTP